MHRWFPASLLALAACGAPADPAPGLPASAPSAPTPASALESPGDPPPQTPADAPTQAAGPATPPAAATRRYVLAAIGDSLTDPRSHGGIYLEVLREHCPNSRFESFGVGGNMANMMRRRFLRDVFGEADAAHPATERPAWTHVLILGGLGDVLSNLTAKRTAGAVQRDLGWMAEQARARGAKAIVLSLPPWKGFNAYDGVRAQMAREVNTWIVARAADGALDATFDTRTALSCGDPERLCKGLGAPDALHWSREGQRKVGEALHEALFSDCE